MKRASVSFSAAIKKKGINPYIDVPKRVSAHFGTRGNIPVKGTLDGVPVRVTLTPLGGGRHELYMNLDMRRRSGTDVGDRVHLVLTQDKTSRMPKTLPVLARALRKKPGAAAAWRAATPSRRKEILRYLHSLKTAESVERNVAKIIRLFSKKR